ncbi:MAG: LLM class flavin-dependent oxidoreductase [Actinobacteria bacterium]|nr:LLM class flavin-dependent oxidoreductase [Actinomycetota bacterium]
MIFSAILLNSIAPIPDGMWRHPRAAAGYDFATPEYWEDLARTLERGGFDAVFLADLLHPHEVYRGSHDPTLQFGAQCPIHDPLMVAPVVARASRHLGIGVTVSTSAEYPYQLARRFATLDHLTGGRMGWNVITSFNEGSFRALGIEQPPREERYARADEFLNLCYELWDSWDEDAVVADRDSGTYTDPAKVKLVDHEGKYFSCRALFPVKPSPQGRPVIWQAGSSPEGRDFAARHAELIFAIQQWTPEMRAFDDDMRGRIAAAGRDQEKARVMYQLQVVTGETEAAAKAKLAELEGLVRVEGALVLMSGIFGYDFSQHDPSDPLTDVAATGVRAGLESILAASERQEGGFTIADAARLYGLSSGSPLVVGSPSQVADTLEEFADEGGADGFNLLPTDMPGSYRDFVDLVIPELRRRGRVRTHYAGTTLRENLFQP